MRRTVLLVFTAIAAAPELAAQPLYEVTVRERRPLTSGSQFVLDAGDLDLIRRNKPDAVLEQIPPLLTAQHAGGGKANQYLVRGFDADHGTDMAFFLDMVPTNMPSHAHGQGYNDMSFLIPETVERVEVSMGPYSPEFGDFAVAGAANFKTWQRAPESFLQLEGGSFQSWRSVGMWSPTTGIFAGEDPKATLMTAFEFNTSDGPFEHGDDLYQYKGLARFGYDLSDRSRIEAWTSLYRGEWNGSGQIPLRLVEGPRFDRWDHLGNREGGKSDREIAQVRWLYEPSFGGRLEVTGWGQHYDLDLYSNFTLFLNDAERGDGIQQRDDRWVAGGSAIYRYALDWARPTMLTGGLETRNDVANVKLSNQRQRNRFGRISDDNILVSRVAGYAEAEVMATDWVRFVGGVRAEGFFFDVDPQQEQKTGPRPSGNESESVVLPKANLIIDPFGEGSPLASGRQPLRDSQLYLNFGQGFHSNDARDVVANPNENVLPTALGWEVGWRTPIDRYADLSINYWWLNLQSEFVFVGDEGVTEPSGRTRRHGVEAAVRVTPLEWLTFTNSLAYTNAEFSNGDHVPQAPRFIAKSSVKVVHESGLSAELLFKHLGKRYAEETGNRKLSSYSVFDFAVRYRRGPFEGSLSIDNLTDTDWASSEFFYASRLPGEPLEGVEDYHFTPGYPRNFLLGMRYYLD